MCYVTPYVTKGEDSHNYIQLSVYLIQCDFGNPIIFGLHQVTKLDKIGQYATAINFCLLLKYIWNTFAKDLLPEFE